MQALKPSPALDRRGFLYRAIQLAAATAATTQLLSACGGGSNAEDATAAAAAGSSGELPPGTFTLAGKVTLPANLSLKDTRVVYPLGQGAVSADGAFQVTFIDGGVGFSQVRDAAGKLLVFGFLRAEQATLSTRSTAEALVFRGLGLWAHAPRIRVAALTLLRSEDLAAVEAAVVSAIAAGGASWVSSAKVGLASAVSAKVATMIGTPPFGAAAKSIQLHGMNLSPTDRVSGLTLEGDGIGTCTVTNSFRRRALVFHTPYAARIEGRPEFRVSESLLKTEVSPTDGLSSPLQAIADLFFERKSLYTPVSVDLAAPIVPAGSVYTKYKVYAVGFGASAGTWDELPQSVKDAGVKVMFTTVVLDFVVPMLCSVLVFSKADAIDEVAKLSEASDVLKDFIGGLARVPELLDLLLKGDLKGCCKATINYIFGTDSVQIAALAALSAILEKALGPYILDPDTGRKKNAIEYFIQDSWAAFDKVLDTGEFALTLFDAAVQVSDFASSRRGETWELTVTRAKVSLTPLAFFVEKNATVTDITATVQNQGEVEGRVFGYRWKCKSGRVYAGGKYGTVIDSTTYNVIGYDAFEVAAGTLDQIDVDVVISGFIDDPVGSAKAKVYVTGLTVTPEEKKKLKANESVTLTAATVGMRPLVAGEKVVYKWTLGGTAGTLTATDTAIATFKADATKEGLGVVTVEAFLGERRIGKAQSNLTVGDKLIVAGRVFEEHFKDASGCHAGILVGIPKIEGATKYVVLVSGMRGPIFGTEYTWTAYVGDGKIANYRQWAYRGNELVMGIGGSNGGGDDCINQADGRWAAWYQGATVQVTVTL